MIFFPHKHKHADDTKKENTESLSWVEIRFLFILSKHHIKINTVRGGCLTIVSSSEANVFVTHWTFLTSYSETARLTPPHTPAHFPLCNLLSIYFIAYIRVPPEITLQLQIDFWRGKT